MSFIARQTAQVVNVQDASYVLGKLQSDAILANIATRVVAHPEDISTSVLALALDATRVFLPASVASQVDAILDARFSPIRKPEEATA